MERKNKSIFLEALLLTVLVFFIGLLIGVFFEGQRVDKIEEYYVQSEISLMDIFAFNNLINLNESECERMINYNLHFADKIYNEAKTLERLEDAGKITDDLRFQHSKYDVMRTLLWINTLKTDSLCEENIHTIVYLYNYNPKDLTERAENSVWSKILSDIKAAYGGELILIPIAVNSDIVSLNALVEDYGLEDFPVLIIDNEYILEDLQSVEDIQNYLL